MSEVTPPSPQPAAPQNGLGTAALVLGIVQFFCFPLIGGVLAIVFGKMGMAKAEHSEGNALPQHVEKARREIIDIHDAVDEAMLAMHC